MPMSRRAMFWRMVTSSILRRRSRVLIAVLAVAIGATTLSGLVTIAVDVPAQLAREIRSYGANLVVTPAGDGVLTDEAVATSSARVASSPTNRCTTGAPDGASASSRRTKPNESTTITSASPARTSAAGATDSRSATAGST